jgi:predicted metal-dependent phosphoesterase TrpH
MTPNNIVNMAALKGLDFIAVTDHNSCGNCAAAIEAAKRTDILVIPGMELCTAEEIHLLCLFSSIEGALSF